MLPPKLALSAETQGIIPQSMVPKIVGLLHNTSTGAHLRVQNLQGKVGNRFYWPGWHRDVKRWCQECPE